MLEELKRGLRDGLRCWSGPFVDILNLWMTAPFSDHFSFNWVRLLLDCTSLAVSTGKCVIGRRYRPWAPPESSTVTIAALLFNRGPRSLKVWRAGGPGQHFPFFWQLMHVGQVSSH